MPYKGAGPAMMDTVPGHDDLYFGALVSTLQRVNSKSLHALAVTSLQRVAVAPDIPPMDEQGLKGFETGAWYSVSVASGTAAEIVQKINAGIVRALRDPDVAKRFVSEGAVIVGDTPQELTMFFDGDSKNGVRRSMPRAPRSNRYPLPALQFHSAMESIG